MVKKLCNVEQMDGWVCLRIFVRSSIDRAVDSHRAHRRGASTWTEMHTSEPTLEKVSGLVYLILAVL